MPTFHASLRRLAPSVAASAIGVLFAAAAHGQAQPSGVTRLNLQRHDISVAGHEAIQVRVDFQPGAVAPRHTHPGEEIVYVLKGSLEYRLDGKAPVTLKAGDVIFIPAGTIHEAKNVGADNASELATYVVEKGKPLTTLAK
jgi:quercetin dioxygenase-like cupin family protein